MFYNYDCHLSQTPSRPTNYVGIFSHTLSVCHLCAVCTV